GQSKTKKLASLPAAQAEADKLIREKTKKGYIETTPKGSTSESLAFEAALRENPDDFAGWCAYADYLVEQGDTRGEFMQVQIALEDEKRPKKEREALKKKEAELLKKHEGAWLGELAPHLLDHADSPPLSNPYQESTVPKTKHVWRRGFLAELQVDCLTVKLAQALYAAPAVRLLQKLHVLSTAYYLSMQEDTTPRRNPGPPEYRGYDEWLELLGAPLLKSLRIFQMGDIDGEPPEDGWSDNHTYAPGIERLIVEMTHVEELHLLCKEYDPGALFALRNLTKLRVLRMCAIGDPNNHTEIPLDVLAKNPTFGNLTHFLLHPHFADDESFIPLKRVAAVFRLKHLKKLTHLQLRLSDMGDEGIEELIASGILKQLKWLDLRHGCVTNEGAKLLAACPDAKRLGRIDLSYNAVRAPGLAALRKAKVNAVANNPLTQAELDQRDFLHHGDFE
ncbi:MAG: TIGR02996 domain-containing protein, partial [Planctomycetia bacterium]|nr:TIGR02996 domain-containing protein [Planctomycetia bacterium]